MAIELTNVTNSGIEVQGQYGTESVSWMIFGLAILAHLRETAVVNIPETATILPLSYLRDSKQVVYRSNNVQTTSMTADVMNDLTAGPYEVTILHAAPTFDKTDLLGNQTAMMESLAAIAGAVGQVRDRQLADSPVLAHTSQSLEELLGRATEEVSQQTPTASSQPSTLTSAAAAVFLAKELLK